MSFEALFQHVPLVDGMFAAVNRVTKETRVYGQGTGVTRQTVDEWIRNYTIPVVSTIRIGSIPDNCTLDIREFRNEDLHTLPIVCHLSGETYEAALGIVYGRSFERGRGFADLSFGDAALVVTYSGPAVSYDDAVLPPNGRVRIRLLRVLKPVE